MEWYYAVDNQQQGPVSHQEFKELVKNKTIKSDTLIWREGMAQWQPLAQVIKGKPTAQPAPPQAPRTDPADASSTGSPIAPQQASGPEATSAPDTAAAHAAPSVAPRAMAVCSECGRTFAEEDVIPYGDSRICAACKPVFVQKLREGVGVSGSMEYAGFWIRFAAKIIDYIAISIVNFVINAVIFMIIGFSLKNPASPESAGMLFGIAYAVVQLLNLSTFAAYDTYFVGKFGATPGKMALKLKIVTSDGDAVSYLRALGRFGAEIISGAILLIGYIMAAFDDERRALHDRICDTRVVRAG